MMPDHYATLGVPPTAKTGDIRAAYLALMREYHPDRNRDPAAVDRAQAIIAAFKVLGDFDRRNHYDWDRRRAREAEAAAAAKRPRRIRAGAVGMVAIGLAAVGAWMLMPAPGPGPGPKPVTAEPKVAQARDLPVAKAEPKQRREVKRVAMVAPAKVKAKAKEPPLKVQPRPEPMRVAKAEPVRGSKAVSVAKAVPVRVPVVAKPKVERAPVVRMAAVKAPAPHAAPKPTLAPPPRQAKVTARPVRPAVRPATDLASLDQFVMNFYGQSWRYGDAPKRAALVQSRNSFVVRRGACAADSCKQDAYLKLMRDVSAIVESGQPKTR